jgi:DNA-3-methyladenine glycosylase I
VLGGAQAGLSGYTITARSASYAKAFDNWNAERIARYGSKDIDRLLSDPGIVRNRAKEQKRHDERSGLPAHHGERPGILR